jgi:DNA-binding MarR family transcriptional regulator
LYRDFLSYRLEWVSKLVRAEASVVYERECGLDIRQLRVLRIVAERSGLTVAQIVDEAMFERTLVSRLISFLVKRGLVARRICDDDARQFRIDITTDGAKMAALADELGDRLNEDLLSSVTAADRKALDRCLNRLMTWRPTSWPADRSKRQPPANSARRSYAQQGSIPNA